jgi:hypothetical protein
VSDNQKRRNKKLRLLVSESIEKKCWNQNNERESCQKKSEEEIKTSAE